MLDHAPDPGLRGSGRVGPNAILQLKGPLGDDGLGQVLHACGVALPTGNDMVPEEDVALVHKTVNHLHPKTSRNIRIAAGTSTGAYIRANRIPAAAKWVMRSLPTAIGERVLTRAILSHAWTFCGTGCVTASRDRDTLIFDIARNPLVDSSDPSVLQCDWHAAVFRDLFAQLLRHDYDAEEVACCGSGAPACRFRITRQ